jgi:hypothetical protein
MVTKSEQAPPAEPDADAPCVPAPARPPAEHPTTSPGSNDTLRLGAPVPIDTAQGTERIQASGAGPAPRSGDPEQPNPGAKESDARESKPAFNPWECQDIDLSLDVQKGLIATELPAVPTKDLYIRHRDREAAASDAVPEAQPVTAPPSVVGHLGRRLGHSSSRVIAGATIGLLLLVGLAVAFLSPSGSGARPPELLEPAMHEPATDLAPGPGAAAAAAVPSAPRPGPGQPDAPVSAVSGETAERAEPAQPPQQQAAGKPEVRGAVGSAASTPKAQRAPTAPKQRPGVVPSPERSAPRSVLETPLLPSAD